MTPATNDMTAMLARVSAGDGEAVNRLLPLVYSELRGLAQGALRLERPDHTLQATAVVHEAYLRLVGQQRVVWRDRAHFYAVAAQAIRRILVDHARSKRRDKRGGGRNRLPLEDGLYLADSDDLDLVALDESLELLASEHPRKAAVVEMRFFGGMTVVEVAEVLKVTTRSVERDWQYARAWLFRALSNEEELG